MINLKAGDLILGLYRVEGLLGQGAMGAVFKIHNIRRQVDLAVKVPTNGALESFGGLEAFRREAETWVNLGFHPHVVRCDYVRKVEDIPLLFVEYVSGGTLLDWIRNRRLYEGSAANSLARMLDVAIQFAWGLIHAHNQGVIHQDVKPANVMMTVDCTAKVGDFGLASSKPQKGTPAYWSPEQAKIARIKDPVARDQLSITATTDVWSWAVSVLEMFSGDATWLSGSLARRILDDYVISGPKIPSIPRMPQRLADLLAGCLEKDAERRPQTMVEVAEELKAIYQEATCTAYAYSLPAIFPNSAINLYKQAMSLVDLGKVEEALEVRNKALGYAEDTYNWGHILWSSAKLAETDLPDAGMPTSCSVPSFSFLRSGTVDYRAHKEKILTLLEAMNEGRVCRITYGSPYSKRNPIFHIKPLKIFSYRDTLYLYALKAKEPWEDKVEQPDFQPLLAIHRIKTIDKADRTVPFHVPAALDFERRFNSTFGIIKDREPFTVEAAFIDWAAVYVEERIWSLGQDLKREDGKVIIKFKASSAPEIISWILQFGDHGRLLAPDWLVKAVRETIERMLGSY